MNKKFFALCLVFIMTVMCVPLTGFAAQNVEHEDLIYDYILDDYLLTTGLEKEEADAIYSEVKNNNDIASEELENIIYGEVCNAGHEENVMYIQDNYNEIISGINEEEKAIVDKCFLDYVLEYYIENGSPEDFVASPMTADVDSFIDEPVFMDNEDFEELYVDENEEELEEINEVSTRAAAPKVASVRIFSDPTKSTVGSSGLKIDVGSHAWITVSNISDKKITVGKFSIAAGKTMALGTWGNQYEHKGLWYNLESKLIKKENAYSNRVSLKVSISSNSLSELNTTIVGYDKWSETNNCSSFAVTCWNKVCATKLSAGVINTPKNLAKSIKGVSVYATGIAVPHYYKVYYANGANRPVVSNVYNYIRSKSLKQKSSG